LPSSNITLHQSSQQSSEIKTSAFAWEKPTPQQ